MQVSKSETILGLGGLQLDDLCVHADSNKLHHSHLSFVFSSAPAALQSSQWTWALSSQCALHQPTVGHQDPPTTTTAPPTATCQLHHITCQWMINKVAHWQQRKPPSIWSWVLNLRDAGKVPRGLLFSATFTHLVLVWLRSWHIFFFGKETSVNIVQTVIQLFVPPCHLSL